MPPARVPRADRHDPARLRHSAPMPRSPSRSTRARLTPAMVGACRRRRRHPRQPRRPEPRSGGPGGDQPRARASTRPRAPSTAARAPASRGINLDLIYGLPHQTVASCLETVEECLALRPDRFAVFGYAHVPGFKKHQRKIDEAALPDGAGAERPGRRDRRTISSRRLSARSASTISRCPAIRWPQAAAAGHAPPQFPGLHHRPGRAC